MDQKGDGKGEMEETKWKRSGGPQAATWPAKEILAAVDREAFITSLGPGLQEREEQITGKVGCAAF